MTMTDFASLSVDAAAPTAGAEVLLTTRDVDRPYRELGVIFVKGHCARYQSIVKKLRAKAKDVGADAVIIISSSPQENWPLPYTLRIIHTQQSFKKSDLHLIYFSNTSDIQNTNL